MQNNHDCFLCVKVSLINFIVCQSKTFSFAQTASKPRSKVTTTVIQHAANSMPVVWRQFTRVFVRYQSHLFDQDLPIVTSRVEGTLYRIHSTVALVDSGSILVTCVGCSIHCDDLFFLHCLPAIGARRSFDRVCLKHRDGCLLLFSDYSVCISGVSLICKIAKLVKQRLHS